MSEVMSKDKNRKEKKHPEEILLKSDPAELY